MLIAHLAAAGTVVAILQQLNENGKLIVFDQDADAKKNLPDDERVIFIPQNFDTCNGFYDCIR